MAIRRILWLFCAFDLLFEHIPVVHSQDSPFCQTQQASCQASCSPPAQARFSCQGSSVSCQCSSGIDQGVTASSSSVGSYPQELQSSSLSTPRTVTPDPGAISSALSGGLTGLAASLGPTSCVQKRMQCEQSCGAGRALFNCDERMGSQSASCSCSTVDPAVGSLGGSQLAASTSETASTADGIAAGPATESSAECMARRLVCEASCGGAAYAQFDCRDSGPAAIASSCSCGDAQLFPATASLSPAVSPIAIAPGACQQERANCVLACRFPAAPRFHCEESETGMAVSCSCVADQQGIALPAPAEAPAAVGSRRCAVAKRQCAETCPAASIMHFRCDDTGASMAVSCSCSAGLAPSPSPMAVPSACSMKRRQCQLLCPQPSSMTFSCGDPVANTPSRCICAGSSEVRIRQGSQASATQARVAPAPLSRVFSPGQAV